MDTTMNATERAAWMKHTANSRYTWTVDPIHNTAADLLVHLSGQSGQYVEISGCKLTVGTYDGAIPHIGEASFKALGTKVFTSNDEAVEYLCRRGNIPVVAALLGGLCLPVAA
jgi:hypothetical protein